MQYVLHNGGLVPDDEVPESVPVVTPEVPPVAPVAPVEVKQEPKVEAPVPLLVPEVPEVPTKL